MWGNLKNGISGSQYLCGLEIPRVYLETMEESWGRPGIITSLKENVQTLIGGSDDHASMVA